MAVPVPGVDQHGQVIDVLVDADAARRFLTPPRLRVAAAFTQLAQAI